MDGADIGLYLFFNLSQAMAALLSTAKAKQDKIKVLGSKTYGSMYWKDIPCVHSKLGFICLGYPLWIFKIDEMSESAYRCVSD
jgi:hypothetical protein